MRRGVALSWFLLACGLPRLAAAQDEPERKALVEAAIRARDAGDHDKALSLALSAEAIHPTSSLTRFVSEEHEALGHVVAAFDAARRCMRMAEGEAPSANHDAVLVGCRSIAAELRSKVALLALRLPAPAPAGMTVQVNGAAPQAPDEPVAVLPGPVRVRASAPQRAPFEVVVDAVAGAEQEVAVVLPVVAAPLAAPVAVVPAAPPPPVEPAPVRSQSLVGPLVVGVGVAALATAGGIRLVADGQYNDFKKQCTSGCADQASRQSGIEHLDTAAAVTAVGGGVLAAVGAGLWIASRRPDSSHPGAWLDVGPTGAVVHGRF